MTHGMAGCAPATPYSQTQFGKPDFYGGPVPAPHANLFPCGQDPGMDGNSAWQLIYCLAPLFRSRSPGVSSGRGWKRMDRQTTEDGPVLYEGYRGQPARRIHCYNNGPSSINHGPVLYKRLAFHIMTVFFQSIHFCRHHNNIRLDFHPSVIG